MRSDDKPLHGGERENSADDILFVEKKSHMTVHP